MTPPSDTVRSVTAQNGSTAAAVRAPRLVWTKAVAGIVVGVVITGVMLAVVLGTGLLPPGSGGYAALGYAAGAVVALLASIFQMHAARAETGMGIQAGLGLGFVAKLLGLALGALVLSLAGVKFEGIAAFAISFAVVALVVQVAGTFHMVRANTARANAACETRRPANPSC